MKTHTRVTTRGGLLPDPNLRLVRAACVVAVLFTGSALALLPRAGESLSRSLVGQCLVASRQLTEPTFAQTVIYLLAHSEAGAMGVVVNRPMGSASLKDLLKGIQRNSATMGRIDLFFGGPVEIDRGLVLHSSDFKGPVTRILGKDLSLSMANDVLLALADGRSPKKMLFLLGYAGWAAGQLEAEIARRDWLIAPADTDLIFSSRPGWTWTEALKRIRIWL